MEYDDCGDVCDDKYFVEKAFINGAKWADKTMIDRACEWLSEIDFDSDYPYDEEGRFDNGRLIEEFRKAMEE